MAEPTSIFVPQITIDGVITGLVALGGIVGGFIAWVRREDKIAATLKLLGTKVDAQGSKIEEHGTKIDKLAGIVETQARHDERLIALTDRVDMMDKRWDDLRRGEGWVLPLEDALRARVPKKP